jgi:hypothetical protein
MGDHAATVLTNRFEGQHDPEIVTPFTVVEQRDRPADGGLVLVRRVVIGGIVEEAAHGTPR